MASKTFVEQEEVSRNGALMNETAVTEACSAAEPFSKVLSPSVKALYPRRKRRLTLWNVCGVLTIGLVYYCVCYWWFHTGEAFEEVSLAHLPQSEEIIQLPDAEAQLRYSNWLTDLAVELNEAKVAIPLRTYKTDDISALGVDLLCHGTEKTNLCIPYGKKTVITLETNTENRTAVIYVPVSLQMEGPLNKTLNDRRSIAPVILMFHGLGDNCDRFLNVQEFVPHAEQNKMVLVSACGSLGYLGVGWNAGVCCGFGSDTPDDLGFANALVEAVHQSVPETDRMRVALMGFSNGAMLSEVLACTSSQWIRAVASVGGVTELRPGNEEGLAACDTVFKSKDGLVVAPHMLMVHGDSDWKVPWGGNHYVGFPSIPANMEGWLNRMKCNKTSSYQTISSSKFENVIYPVCGDSHNANIKDVTTPAGVSFFNPSVELVRGKKMGHIWPSDSQFDTTTYIFGFFKKALQLNNTQPELYE